MSLYLYQTESVTPTKTYRVAFDYSSDALVTAGTLIYVGFSAEGELASQTNVTSLTNATYSYIDIGPLETESTYFNLTVGIGQDTVFFTVVLNTGGTVTFDNVSVKEVLGEETESLPYTCTMALGYRSNRRRQGLQSFDKLYSEGYITEGTPLDVTINYDYQGSTAIINAPINSIERPARLFSGAAQASLGDSSLGDEPLGEGIFDSHNTQDLLAKFKNINSLAITNCFEYQPIFSSDMIDSRWEMLAVATNALVETEQDATYIINRIRTT